MHFWIDKRNQGRGFNVRRQVPPSLSGYGRNQRSLCGFFPKPMVTPVHRFQSIESAVNNGLRYNRSPAYHTRSPGQSSVHFNGSSNNVRVPQIDRSPEIIAGHIPPVRNHSSPTSKLKYGIRTSFVLLLFILAMTRFYLYGVHFGVEALVFCSLLVVVLIIGGLISLCEAIITYSPANTRLETPLVQVAEHNCLQTEYEENLNQVIPTVSQNPTSEMSELPPPPYHIAVMLSPQNELDTVQIIGDSPPPSYDKVT